MTAPPVEHARLIAEISDALQDSGLAEADARALPLALDARLERLQASLDRIEARLTEVEQELALLIAPSWPF